MLSSLQENARVRNSTISLASTLSKKVSQLISALTPGKRQVSSEDGLAEVLLGQMETAAGVMSSAKLLIHWLDHNPSTLVEDYDTFRNDVMMSALDLVAILVRKIFAQYEVNIIILDICMIYHTQQNSYDTAQMLESVSVPV